MTAAIRDIQRIATPSIRGYYFQFLFTAIHWIDLSANEMLYCEGSEDIDKVLENGHVSQEAIKHMERNVTENSDVVKDALLNFAKEYVFQRRRGISVSFVFRTTSSLGKAHNPLLQDWLGGSEANIEHLKTRLLVLAKAQPKPEKRQHSRKELSALAAVRFMSRYNWLNEFASAIKWVWDERDYDEQRSELIQRIQETPRFEKIRADKLADLMIARIARISSIDREDVACRRLTSLDLDLLINDELIDKLADHYGPRKRLPAIYVGYHEAFGRTALVAARFTSETTVEQAFQALKTNLRHRPGGISTADPFDQPLGGATIETLRTVNVDFYATFCRTSTIGKREVRLRWLLFDITAIASARVAIGRFVVSTQWQQQAIEKHNDFNGRVTLNASASNACEKIAALVAQALAEQASDEESIWKTIHPAISTKLRLIRDWDKKTIFTQDYPLV